jgi:ribosomal protein L11 methyltransferase
VVKVIAIDIDEWSIKNATENLLSNNSLKTELRKADTIIGSETFDIILANINKNVILDHFFSLINHFKSKGILLLNGLLKEDEEDILKEAKEFLIQKNKLIESSNWVSIRLIR